MPRSRAERPCDDAAHASRDDAEKIACSTTASLDSSTVGSREAPGAETANPVVLITISGFTA
jgi:hypothetical protein